MSAPLTAKAARAKQLLDDPLVKEIVADLRTDAQAQAFDRNCSSEKADEARRMVWALDDVLARLQTLIDTDRLQARRK
jgi:hypothetical protein